MTIQDIIRDLNTAPTVATLRKSFVLRTFGYRDGRAAEVVDVLVEPIPPDTRSYVRQLLGEEGVIGKLTEELAGKLEVLEGPHCSAFGDNPDFTLVRRKV